MAMQDGELINAFLVESSDILERIEIELQRYERAENPEDAVNAVFRGIHTIKGNSSFLELAKVTRLSHVTETLLDFARKNLSSLDSEFPNVCLIVVEKLREILQGDYDSVEIESSVRIVEDYAAKFSKGKPAKQIAVTPPVVYGEDPFSTKNSAVGSNAMESMAKKRLAGSAGTQTVRIEERKVNQLVSLVSELEILRYSFDLLPEKLELLKVSNDDFRYDVDFMVSRLSRVTKSLGGITFGIRLVPVNQVFQRFPKVVTELAHKLGKSIELQVLNGEAELDKSIVDAIADPLTHLIRNSADHGVEDSQERVRKGKSPIGKICLNSYVKGNFVFVEITDDGRGIDGEKVLKKAIEKGIVPKDKASGFTESQKLSLIFAPGFSTAEKITDISGRGVGMDVVKSNINRLKGNVLIDSEVGKGTKIRLRFPMSTVVLLSLFVESNKVICGLPVGQIEESVDFQFDELLKSPPAVLESDRKLYSVYSLKELLWGIKEEISEDRLYHVVRFNMESGKNLVFVVDDFTSIEEAIVQSVDSYISALPGIQGASMRKDGTVALFLNPENLIERALRCPAFAYVMSKEKLSEKEAVNNLSDFLEMSG